MAKVIEILFELILYKENHYSIKAIDEVNIIELQIGDELIEEDIERFDWEWKN